MRISRASQKDDHRMWIYWGKDSENHITLERGRWFAWDFGFHLEFGDDITLGLYLGIVDVYISLDWQPARRFFHNHPNYHFKHTLPNGEVKKGSYWEERNIGLRLDLRAMTLAGEWWVNMNDEPRKRHFYWFLQDKIFGRAKYSEKVLEEGNIEVDMPEGVYKGTFKRFVSYWKRPRWPFVQSLHRMSFDIPAGIPHEGKGENSWDMGMDATFGTTFPIEEGAGVFKAVKDFAIRCLIERQKYGSLHSPDYAKWKLEREVALEKEKALAKQHDIPEDLVPRAFGEIKERE